MKKLHPITSGILQAITAGFTISFIFICSLGLLAAYGQPFLEWMDKSPRTGIVILIIGTLALSVLFFTTKNKRN